MCFRVCHSVIQFILPQENDCIGINPIAVTLTYSTNHSFICNQRCIFICIKALLVMCVNVNIYSVSDQHFNNYYNEHTGALEQRADTQCNLTPLVSISSPGLLIRLHLVLILYVKISSCLVCLLLPQTII